MRPVASILLGSGFSIPEGIPGVGELNNRLKAIDESEIIIHTDMHAFFLDGQVDLNRGANRDERVFLQEFLEFYNAEVLKSGEQFHYETFFDYYSRYLHDGENAAEIEQFCDQFNDRHLYKDYHRKSASARMDAFDRSFQQLVAGKLHKSKYFEDVNLSGYPQYGAFISFIGELLKAHNVKVHTLNHDIFFDFLGRSHDTLWQHFSDGYELVGSRFYGKLLHTFQHRGGPVSKCYTVKLERFVDKFDTSLCLFKLHGSINSYVVTANELSGKPVRLKGNFAVSQYKMEYEDPDTGKSTMIHLADRVQPDFLSGTTNKIRYYSSDPFYQSMFKYFQNNLMQSELLVVIGYGFQDAGINEFLERCYLNYGKEVVVIDPCKPKSDLLDKYPTNHIHASLVDIPYSEYLKLLPS
jgi:hypothetical protein